MTDAKHWPSTIVATIALTAAAFLCNAGCSAGTTSVQPAQPVIAPMAPSPPQGTKP